MSAPAKSGRIGDPALFGSDATLRENRRQRLSQLEVTALPGFYDARRLLTTGLRRMAIGVPPLTGLLTMLCNFASVFLPV